MGDGLHFSLPAYPVTDVIDPTGAGDCFAGGFMGRSRPPARRRVLRAAMLHGTVAASYCVQGFSVEDIGKRGSADYDTRSRSCSRSSRSEGRLRAAARKTARRAADASLVLSGLKVLAVRA